MSDPTTTEQTLMKIAAKAYGSIAWVDAKLPEGHAKEILIANLQDILILAEAELAAIQKRREAV